MYWELVATGKIKLASFPEMLLCLDACSKVLIQHYFTNLICWNIKYSPLGQLYMLDVFMGEEFHIYGLNVINRFIKRDDWTQSQRFPRVTLCDFQVSLVTKEILFHYHSISQNLTLSPGGAVFHYSLYHPAGRASGFNWFVNCYIIMVVWEFYFSSSLRIFCPKHDW